MRRRLAVYVAWITIAGGCTSHEATRIWRIWYTVRRVDTGVYMAAEVSKSTRENKVRSVGACQT
jgi:hypothetical protein